MHFFKTLDFDGFCENSAIRRDWHPSTHLVEGPGPHVSDPLWAAFWGRASRGGRGLKELAGATLANQGRSHEARGLLRDGQTSANHDGRLSFHKTNQNQVF